VAALRGRRRGGDLSFGELALVAAFLDFLEEAEVLLEGALEATLVEGEEVEVFAAVEPGIGVGEGDGGLFGVALHLVGLAESDGHDGVFDL